MAREARGLNNQGKSNLYFLDPDINLLRDPRWGRAQEVYMTLRVSLCLRRVSACGCTHVLAFVLLSDHFIC